MLLACLVAASVFLIGLVIGAYSHDWLAKVTGAPSNLTSSTAVPALVSAAKTGAQAAINAAHSEVSSKISSLV